MCGVVCVWCGVCVVCLCVWGGVSSKDAPMLLMQQSLNYVRIHSVKMGDSLCILEVGHAEMADLWESDWILSPPPYRQCVFLICVVLRFFIVDR